MALFSLKKDIEKFKNSSSKAGKLGMGVLIAGKGIANTAAFFAENAAKTMLNHSNSTPEQKAKAREFLDNYNSKKQK